MSEQKKRPNNRLKQEREIRGWSQEDLAEKVGTTQKIVSRWERGDSRPLPYYRQKLCQLFDKSAKELGFLDDSPETDPQIAPVSEESSPAQSSPDMDVYGYKPIQVLVPDNTNCVVTIHIEQQIPAPASISSEENAIIDVRMMNTPGQGQQSETGAIVNRRDFNRKVLGIAATTLIASDALTESELLERFHRALKKPTTIDITTLNYLRKCTGSYYQDRHDVNVASFDVLTYALDHFRKVTGLLEESLLPAIRTHLISIAGEIAQLIGELHFEMGNYPEARAYYKAATKAAQEANDRALQSIALGWMSFTWTYSGDKQEALSCIQQARSLASGHTNATISAWLAAIEAEAQANLDNLEGCRRSLDDAECVDEQIHSLEVSHWIHFDRSLLEGYQGICFLRLYRPGNTERSALLLNAKNSLTNALELLNPTLMRRQPTYLADLASVDIRQGEIEEACERANQAVAVAVQIKSQMVTERLLTLRRELELWKNTQHVKNLDEHLAPLLPTFHRGNA